MSEQPHRHLEQLCNVFRRRLRFVLFQNGFARTTALGVLLFLVMAAVDWWFHFGTATRFAMLAVYLLAVGYAIWSICVAPLSKSWSNHDVLGYLDNVLPDSQGMLLDYYELATSPEEIQETETEIGRQLTEQAATQVEMVATQVQVGQAIDHQKANRWLGIGLIFALVLIAIGMLSPEHLRIGATRLFNPLATVRWPHRTTILVALPENGWTVPQLESFAVQAAVTGEIPARVTLAYRSGEDGHWIRERLEIIEQNGEHTVSYTFPEVRDPIEFQLEGGDYISDPFEIAIIRRPFLTAIAAHYAYPDYAGIPDATRNSGQISGLEGTQVTLDMECSLPLEKAVLIYEQNDKEPERISLDPKSETQLHHTFMLETDGRYSLELYDKNGYREAKPEAYDIRVTADEPPEIELLSPARDMVETRQASIDVAFRASDKLGLKEVQFLYKIDDDPQEHSLSDRFTGPIAQTGNESNTRFTWQLRRMEDSLPEQGKLSFFVRVQDNNPTGRGVRESQPASIRLVKPSEFHLDAIERAKLLEEEARIAWRNQLHAWQLGTEWLKTGTGELEDEVWTNMKSAQEKSFLATKQIQFHLESLTEKYDRNHMSRDFMAGRLSVIAQLLSRLTNQEHATITSLLEQARPKSAADAEPTRLKSLRTEVLAKAQDNQKLAVLVLERMLRKLYDWRDLQNCTITTKLLYEQQEEVQGRTSTLAPKTIAKEIEDLADDDQEQLLTLGKQQRAIFDTETGLENQLTYLTYKAEKQQRLSILVPLRAAWANLRNQRVNDYLKRAAELIDNNQPSQILKDQTAAIRALRLVEDGLIIAGQKIDPDPPLTLSMTPSEESQFDPDLVKPEQVAEAQPNEQPAEVEPLQPGGAELPSLPEGTDALSAAVRRMIELQDNVLARTRYLAKNRTEAEMPRFIKLKLLRLQQREDLAIAESKKAISEANKENQPVEGVLQSLSAEFQQVQELLKQNQTDDTTQQFQADAITTLRELLQLLAMEKSVRESAAENKRLGGVDAFDRPYLLRDQELETVVNLLLELNHARLSLADVLRKLNRFKNQPAMGEAVMKQEQVARKLTAKVLKKSAELIESTKTRLESLSAETNVLVRKTGLEDLTAIPLATLADPITNNSLSEENLTTLNEANQLLVGTIQSLRDLLEERVKPKVELAAPEKTPVMTPEEFAKLTSRETLAERLKDEASLPPELREQMLRSLEKKFPEKYRELLQAYYASFLKPAPKENGENK